jgi:hypothetical protein
MAAFKLTVGVPLDHVVFSVVFSGGSGSFCFGDVTTSTALYASFVFVFLS